MVASMGPPIYIGGNTAIRVAIRGLAIASMGPPIYIGGNKGLRLWIVAGDQASMGPPIYIGGNVNVRVGTCGIVRLQWGHRFISVETTYVLV